MLDAENNHDGCKAQSFIAILSARQPFPTACLRKNNNNKKKKSATYRDLSWQLSQKKKKIHTAASEQHFQISLYTTPRMYEHHQNLHCSILIIQHSLATEIINEQAAILRPIDWEE